ncbi:acyl carrier protein [Enterococcus asini]|nr:acyl carrier protein [Enterococcus asini]
MQLTREEVFSKVAGVIANHFEIDPEKVTDQMSIKDDLNADSISVMEFVLELEDEFGTEISDEDAEQIETVGGAVDYVYNRLNK